MMQRVTAIAAVVAGAFAFAGPAEAFVTCSYNAGSHTLTVNMPASGDHADIARSGQSIVVNTLSCAGGPTLTNTDTVNVIGASGSDQIPEIDLAGGSFARPAGDVKFTVVLGGDYFDRLIITGGGSGTAVTIGSSGVNLDRGDGDSDVSLFGVGGIEFDGGAGNDTATGAGGDGTGAVYPNNMKIFSAAGADVLVGGAGSDRFDGGPGNDSIDGGTGPVDVLEFFDPPGVVVDLAAGTSTGQGSDTIANMDGVSGSPGNDTIYGDANANGLDGGDGNDTIHGRGGNDAVSGDAGSSFGNDHLYGDAGNDQLYPGKGVDTLDGGADTDTASYADGSSGVTASLTGGTATGTQISDTLTAIESLDGSWSADTLTGEGGGNVLIGHGGNDTLKGMGGNDVLDPGAGTNSADGGSGSDWVAFLDASSGVTVALPSVAGGGGQSTSLTSIENVLGSPFADAIGGDAGPNLLYGLPGNDQLFGNAGDDQLVGGNGDDTLDGGAGHDTCVQGPGIGTKTDCEA
jgi:Ca2+-binding RTX toxin-like protein